MGLDSFVLYLLTVFIAGALTYRCHMAKPLKVNLLAGLLISAVVTINLFMGLPKARVDDGFLSTNLLNLLMGAVNFVIIFVILWSSTHILFFLLSITGLRQSSYASGKKTFLGVILLILLFLFFFNAQKI